MTSPKPSTQFLGGWVSSKVQKIKDLPEQGGEEISSFGVGIGKLY